MRQTMNTVIRVDQVELNALPSGGEPLLLLAHDAINGRSMPFTAASYSISEQHELGRRFANWAALAPDSMEKVVGACYFREADTVGAVSAPAEVRLAVDYSQIGEHPDYEEAFVGRPNGQAIAFSRSVEYEVDGDQLRKVPTIRLSYSRARTEVKSGAAEVVDMLTARSAPYALGVRIIASEPSAKEPWYDGSFGDFKRQYMAEPIASVAMHYAQATDYPNVSLPVAGATA